MYSVCKQNDVHTRPPRTGCEIIRAHRYTHDIYKTLKPRERVSCQRCFLSLFSLSLCCCVFPSTRQTNDQFSRARRWWRAATAVKLDVWMCTIQRPRWRKPRFVFYHHRVLLLLLCVHYNINAVVNFMHRWQTRVVPIYICIIYKMQFLLCTRVYTTNEYNTSTCVRCRSVNVIPFTCIYIYVRGIHIIATTELWVYVIIICGFMYTYYIMFV